MEIGLAEKWFSDSTKTMPFENGRAKAGEGGRDKNHSLSSQSRRGEASELGKIHVLHLED